MSIANATGQLVPFTYGATTVRTIIIDGEPWFVSMDALSLLDLSRSSLSSLDDDEKGVHTVDTLGGPQQVAIISESGLYSMILRSRKPEAKAIRKWVTSEVLPEIRRTGSYSAAPALTVPSGPELLALAVVEAQQMLAAKDERIAELAPKADLADTYLTAQGGARLVREVAKTLSWREKDFRRWLIEERMIFAKHAPCGNVQYDFYAEFAHHFQTREKVIEHTWGTCTHYTLLILPRGVELIRKRMTRSNGGAS